MNNFEKTQPHYLKEYSKTIEEYLTIGRPVSEPVLKYDEKAAPFVFVVGNISLRLCTKSYLLPNLFERQKQLPILY